jgi:DNA helicase HerA-like ATPase
MALQFANENLVLVIAGCSGSGKSTVAICWLLNAKLTCRFIFDPSGEYAIRFNRRPVTTAAELRAAIGTGWVIYDPKHLFPGSDIAGTDAASEAFSKFCEWAWIVSRDIPGQKILMADEIWQFCSPNFIPIALRAIIQNGRKNGIGLLATTQKPNKMNETILGEATEFIGFRLAGRNLLKSLEDNIEIFPVHELPGLLLVDKVKSHCIAQNLRSGGLRRYELDFTTGKLTRLR